jgi:hypothetical protein
LSIGARFVVVVRWVVVVRLVVVTPVSFVDAGYRTLDALGF